MPNLENQSIPFENDFPVHTTHPQGTTPEFQRRGYQIVDDILSSVRISDIWNTLVENGGKSEIFRHWTVGLSVFAKTSRIIVHFDSKTDLSMYVSKLK